MIKLFLYEFFMLNCTVPAWIQILLLIVLWDYFVIMGESCHPDDISVSVLYGVLIQSLAAVHVPIAQSYP
jgi:hypothetical protein